MWFKQALIYRLSKPIAYDPEQLTDQIFPLAFTPCLPSFPVSYGWVSPITNDDSPLVHAMHGYLMICLQIEEKILPATVVNQTLQKKVKEIEKQFDRKVSQKEKYSLKDEIIQTLLPKAFSKLSHIYAYFDVINNWLILDTVSLPRAEIFLKLLKKSFADTNFHALETKKLAPILTQWITHSNYPQMFSIEKACVLTDPNQTNRIVRCQQQDLFANCIQSIIKDGCQIKEIALSWQERVSFVLLQDCSLRSIKFHDAIIAQSKELEPSTMQQQFDADFIIMVETFNALFNDLFSLIVTPAPSATPSPACGERDLCNGELQSISQYG